MVIAIGLIVSLSVRSVRPGLSCMGVVGSVADKRLWICEAHEMIGNQQEAHGHQQAYGCKVEELSQEVSDGVRDEWRKQVTAYDGLAGLFLADARRRREGR